MHILLRFFLFFERRQGSEVTARNSAKPRHMFGSGQDWKGTSEIWGPP